MKTLPIKIFIMACEVQVLYPALASVSVIRTLHWQKPQTTLNKDSDNTQGHYEDKWCYITCEIKSSFILSPSTTLYDT